MAHQLRLLVGVVQHSFLLTLQESVGLSHPEKDTGMVEGQGGGAMPMAGSRQELQVAEEPRHPLES